MDGEIEDVMTHINTMLLFFQNEFPPPLFFFFFTENKVLD